MYKRHLADFLNGVASKYPVVTIVGPRQSGKSTLSRTSFPHHTYLSMEEPDRREMAEQDPRGFFKRFTGPLILDEIQRVPDLLSYIQTEVDEPKSDRHFVLTGSHQMLLMEKITQSLAGRTVITKLLPLSRRELLELPAEIPLGKAPDKKEKKETGALEKYIHTGGYPRIYDRQLEPGQWLEQYYQTYVERDVRALLRVSELDLFDRFIRLCAGRAGQLLNLSSLASDCGISQPTAQSWLSVLKASFICFTLQPHFRNFSKRLIKSPKLYFFDTGLLCYLLKIRTPETIAEHPFRGSLFENWVIAEWMKSFFNRGMEPPFYFWRDTKGHEADLVLDLGPSLYPIEIKSAYTFHPDFTRNLQYLAKLQRQKNLPLGESVYAGKESFTFKDFFVRSWQAL